MKVQAYENGGWRKTYFQWCLPGSLEPVLLPLFLPQRDGKIKEDQEGEGKLAYSTSLGKEEQEREEKKENYEKKIKPSNLGEFGNKADFPYIHYIFSSAGKEFDKDKLFAENETFRFGVRYERFV